MSNDTIFQCRYTSFLESIEAPLTTIASQSRFLSELNLFLDIVPRSPPFSALFGHFSAYSSRKMAFTEDILKGIHGVVQALQDL